MRSLLTLAVALLLSGAALAKDPNFHVFLCLGQSNMEGFPGIPDADKAYANERFQVLAAVDFPALGRQAGQWYTATPPLCRPNSGLSPADAFGRALVAHLPAGQKVGVVSVAVAGAKLEVFDPARVAAYAAASPAWLQNIVKLYDGDPYAHLLKLARRAQQDGVIRGILLHQGESNTGDATWPAQVKALYERLLADLGLQAEQVPLLVGEVVGADQNGACAALNRTIASLPGLIPTAHVVSSAGAACHRDRLHFTPAGYHLLGHRYAEAMLPLLGYPAIAPARPAIPPDVVTPVAAPAVRLFDLADVTLGPGPFRDAMNRDRAYLLGLEPDRFLHTFRLNVGLPSAAQPYGGWEAPGVELRGHSAGHYLTACALMFRSTGDAAFKQRVDAMVDGFAACQAASVAAGFHDGYLSAFPESFLDRVDKGEWVWAPWYTLHKVMTGLLDAHRLTGNARAREVLVKMAGWVAFRVDRLTPDQMQAALKMEFGGMNDVLAGLYALTGDPVHLRLARAFDHAAVFDPLARGEDPLDGLHANTQIPKVIGAAREFALTGEERYDRIARAFWENVALRRSYAIGGNSDREHFFPPATFAAHLGGETAETCNTYNMLKLSRDLFAQEPAARYMDFYERGLYNHILASSDPARGMFTYLTPLGPGHAKTYSTPENSFWCCVGTGMENHAKYGDTVFAQAGDELYVNLFLPATVRWRERGVTLTQATTFPHSADVAYTVESAAPVTFTLRLRHPGWAAAPLRLSVNGAPATDLAGTPGSYATVTRTWQPGDRLTLTLPLALRAEPLPGDDRIVALFYGPVALAGLLGTDGLGPAYVGSQTVPARFPAPDAPVFVPDGANWLGQVVKLSDEPLVFRTRGLGRPEEVTLVPFHTVHHERTAVYWPLLDAVGWTARAAAVATVEAQLADARTRAMDRVLPGDAVSEQAHALVLTGTAHQTGAISGRTWRQAVRPAAFGYTLATGGRDALALVCAVGARDRNRSYDIWVDDTKLEAPDLDGLAPGLVLTFTLPIPPELTRGKKSLAVRIQPRDAWDATTANLFECLLVPGP